MEKRTFFSSQGSQIDFAFHTLGWFEFQNLCAMVLREVLGQIVDVASEGNDAGADAAFQGTWISQKGEIFSGNFIAQVKFSRDKTKSISKGLFSKEIEKAKKLVSERLCDHYFVFTNHTCTRVKKIEVEKYLKENITGVKTVKIYGPENLRDWIRESPRLRMLVPRVYGIGDVSLLLTEKARMQADAVLKTIGAGLKTIVPTDAYYRAAAALDKHGFVLLIGNPMAGKTTIGYALALAAADCFDREVFLPATPAEFKEHFDPDNNKRFYWVDDAFGQITYNPGAALDWNNYLNALEAAISKGCKVVFTSRTYIWEAAKKDLKHYSFSHFENSQVLIEVEKLTKNERKKILYNHLRMGNQSYEFKEKVKPFCEKLAEINEFLPESARRLADQFFTKHITINIGSLTKFFKEPENILIDSIEQLGGASKALLAIMFANGSSLTSPISFTEQDRHIAETHGVSASQILPEVRYLKESFIREIVDFHGSIKYVFAHPSFRDALADIYSRNPEWLRLYIMGARMVDLLTEVTCGNVGIIGMKVIISPEYFEVFLDRFLIFWSEYYSLEKTPNPMPYNVNPRLFLGYRCNKEFLELVIEKKPNLIEKFGIYYDPVTHDPCLQIVIKLQEYGIL